MEHRHAFGKLFKGLPTWRYFGRNLGSLNANLMKNKLFGSAPSPRCKFWDETSDFLRMLLVEAWLLFWLVSP
jgi:hypothetical protein